MANIVNLDSETGANMIGDDSQPTLTIGNSSTGRGLDLSAVGAAALRINKVIGAANATGTAGIELVGASAASGAVLALLNKSSYVSTTTIKFNTAVAANTGAIRIVLPDGTFGYIPVMDPGDVTGVAV